MKFFFEKKNVYVKKKKNSYINQEYQNLDFLTLLLADLRDGDWLREVRRERFGEPLRDLDLHVNELETSVGASQKRQHQRIFAFLIPSWRFAQRASRTRRPRPAAFRPR